MSAREVPRSEIADFLGVAAGARRDVLLRVSSIDSADATAVVFAADDRSLGAAVASPAGLILASREVDREDRILVVDEPRIAFARVYQRWFRLEGDAEGALNASAIISPSATLGLGCRIDAGAVIEAGAQLGAGCWIGPRAVIHANTRLGDRVRVQAGAVLGSDGFGYAHHAGQYIAFPQIGTLVIGDDVEIGANTTIDRGALGETRIGSGTKIDNLVHIAHNCVIGRNVLIAAQVGMAGSTMVEDGAMLGGQAGIGEHATIGRGVVLGGQGGVLPGKTISGPGEVFWGTPAQPVREFLRDLARLRRTKG